MFGMMEALLSFIRRQVGLRTDVANATGSLHAKIENIIAIELPKLQKPRHAVRGSFSTSVTSDYQTALSISGRGSLKFLGCLSSSNHGADYIKLTVDGNVMGWGYASGRDGLTAMVPSPDFFMQTYENDGGFEYNVNYTGEGTPYQTFEYRAIGNGFVDIPFSTSLKIEVKHFANSPNVVYWIYDIE